ncbi:MAG: META domain-containing protein [Sphingomonadaceae bacterium]
MKATAILAGLGLGVLLMGCESREAGPATSAPQPETRPAAAPEAAAAPAALAGAGWTIFEVEGEAVSGVTMAFAEGRIAGRSACNRYTGVPGFSGANGLSVPRAASTMMACPEPQMQTEQKFLKALEQVARWSVADGTLTLSAADGSVLMRGRRD